MRTVTVFGILEPSTRLLSVNVSVLYVAVGLGPGPLSQLATPPEEFSWNLSRNFGVHILLETIIETRGIWILSILTQVFIRIGIHESTETPVVFSTRQVEIRSTYRLNQNIPPHLFL